MSIEILKLDAEDEFGSDGVDDDTTEEPIDDDDSGIE